MDALRLANRIPRRRESRSDEEALWSGVRAVVTTTLDAKERMCAFSLAPGFSSVLASAAALRIRSRVAENKGDGGETTIISSTVSRHSNTVRPA